jgi:DhnA family fructose-bisphosphate aldolase class Ia
MGRLFNKESGRSLVTALDHAVTLGAAPGNIDALQTLETCIAGNPDAILLGPGLLNKGGHLFAHREAPGIIVRCDYILNHPFLNDLGEGYQQICTVEHAAFLGGDAVVMFLMVGAENREMWKANVAAISRISEDAHRLGMPLIVESVLWGSRIRNQKDPEKLAYGARVAVEIGADIVKTEYSGDASSMRDIIAACPAPVLVLGGAKTSNPDALWAGTRQAIQVGAKGVIYGRNIWQSNDPVGVSRMLREMIHGS